MEKDASYGPGIKPAFLRYCVAPGEFMREYNGGEVLKGFDAYLTATVPPGGGVSSSSALVVACTMGTSRSWRWWWWWWWC